MRRTRLLVVFFERWQVTKQKKMLIPTIFHAIHPQIFMVARIEIENQEWEVDE